MESETLSELVVLVLDGVHIYAQNAVPTPLYHLSRSIDSLTHKDSSLYFARIDDEAPERHTVDSTPQAPAQQKLRQLFYLVHPLNAKYRTDQPAYFMTSNSSDLPGNIKLETSKSLLRRPKFTALLSANRTASSAVLFDENGQNILFNVKPTLLGGGFTWTDSGGDEVAREESKGDQKILVVTSPMARAKTDTLAALWVLRLWHDIAKDRQFTRKGLEDMTPASNITYGDRKLAKRAGAASGFAAMGGI